MLSTQNTKPQFIQKICEAAFRQRLASATTSPSGCCRGLKVGAHAPVWRPQPSCTARFRAGGSIGTRIPIADVLEAIQFQSHFPEAKESPRLMTRRAHEQ